MIRILLIALAFFITHINEAVAKGSNILKVMLSTGEPLTIQIDGRDYKKTGSAITVGDLPDGWHSLRVYRYLPYQSGGGHAKLIYNGRVKLKKSSMMSFVVNPANGNVKSYSGDVAEVRMKSAPRAVAPPVRNEPTVNRTPDPNIEHSLSVAELDEIALKIQEMPTDINALKTLKAELEDETYSTDQLRTMMGWLAFDESRVDLAKWSYAKLVDKQNVTSLTDMISMDEKKEEFRKWAERQ